MLEIPSVGIRRAEYWYPFDKNTTNADGSKTIQWPAIAFLEPPWLNNPTILVDIEEVVEGEGLIKAVFIALLRIQPVTVGTSQGGNVAKPSPMVTEQLAESQRWLLF